MKMGGKNRKLGCNKNKLGFLFLFLLLLYIYIYMLIFQLCVILDR